MFLQAKRSATRYYLSPTGSDSNPCTSSQPCLTVLGVKNQVGAGDYSAVEVCLNAGTYDIDGGTTDRAAASGFMTITPCPGVSKSSVTISAVSNRAPRVTKTLVKGVLMSGISNWNAANGTALWLDDVDIDGNCKGSSGCVPVNVNGGNFDDGVFMTNTLVTDYFEGSPNLKLVRNVTIDNINQDSFKQARVIIASVSQNITNCCSVHPDLYQIESAPLTNLIVYGLTAVTNVDSQGLFTDANAWMENVAFVDINIDNTASGRPAYSLNGGMTTPIGPSDNVFLWNTNFTTTLILERQDPSPTNFVMIDGACTGASIGPIAGYTYYNSATCD